MTEQLKINESRNNWYQPNASLIGDVKSIADSYDENASLLGEMFAIVDSYVDENNMVERNAIAYEAMSSLFKQYDSISELIGSEEDRKKSLDENRQNNKTGLLPSVDDVTDAVGNVLGSLSLSSFGIDDIIKDSVSLIQNPSETVGNFLNEAKDSAIESSIRELQSLMSRAVGPLEEIPADMLTDGIRRATILSDTQTSAEHSLMARLHQLKGNRLIKDSPFGGTSVLDSLKLPNIPTLTIGDNSGNLKKALTNPGGYPGKTTSPLIGPVKLPLIGAIGIPGSSLFTSGNKWLPNRFGGPEYFTETEFDGFEFKIQNLAKTTNDTMAFPAYIDSMQESDSASWTSKQLINRSEEIFIYKNASRDINLDFILFANDKDYDLGMGTGVLEKEGKTPMRHKLIKSDGSSLPLLTKSEMEKRKTFLHQCLRPGYSNGRFYSSPYCRLWIGSLFRGIYLIIENVNFSYDPLVWDINDKNIVPMIVKVSLKGILLHGTSLSCNSEDFNNFEGAMA